MEATVDNCTACGHRWHGLECGMRTDKFNTETGKLSEYICTCPSQFGNPSTYDLSRQALAYAEHL